MAYYYSKTVDIDFDEAVSRITQALKSDCFDESNRQSQSERHSRDNRTKTENDHRNYITAGFVYLS